MSDKRPSNGEEQTGTLHRTVPTDSLEERAASGRPPLLKPEPDGAPSESPREADFPPAAGTADTPETAEPLPTPFDPAQPSHPAKPPLLTAHELRGWFRDIFFATLTAILIVVFIIQPVKVEGTSMEPKLEDQERIFVNKFVYHLGEINRGDIVVFWYPRDPSKSFIKRVIGLPSETLEIRSGVVYVSGSRLSEPYVPPSFFDYASYPMVRIPESHYFVLGDHRNSSNDSRNWGYVPRENIFGKAIFRYWPVSKLGLIE